MTEFYLIAYVIYNISHILAIIWPVVIKLPAPQENTVV